MSVPEINPDDWLLSLWRTFGAYIAEGLPPNVYTLRFSHPDAKEQADLIPLPKPMIHFEIDNIERTFEGFGRQAVDAERNEPTSEIRYHEMRAYEVTLDVGIWASTEAGGVTARLRARQRLSDLFDSPKSIMSAAGYGLEIRRFRGGTFIRDEVNNIPVFRAVDMDLTIRVFARRKIEPVKMITSFSQLQELTIMGFPVS